MHRWDCASRQVVVESSRFPIARRSKHRPAPWKRDELHIFTPMSCGYHSCLLHELVARHIHNLRPHPQLESWSQSCWACSRPPRHLVSINPRVLSCIIQDIFIVLEHIDKSGSKQIRKSWDVLWFGNSVKRQHAHHQQ